MEPKNFLMVGGSSGIGMEIVKALGKEDNEIYVGSRTHDQLSGLDGVHHFRLDVKADPLNLEAEISNHSQGYPRRLR